MTQEKKVQTAAVMDVTGVERAAQDAVRAAKTMADGIAREGEKAGKGIEAMGEGASRAERTVDAKTKSISDRIRRLTQQSQRELAGLAASSAGGPGSASAVEYEATIRGADVSKLQPQIAALRDLQTQANALATAMRQAMAGDEFIAGVNQRIVALQRQAASSKTAEADMLALRAAELGVTQQADPLIAKLRATAAAAEEAAAASKRAAAGDNFLQGLTAQANAIGKSRADLLELKAAELGVTQQAAPMIAAIRAADGELLGLGKNAKLTAAAMRLVPAQFTDIVVSLQAGQNPLQVFLQQGGQLKDMFGGIGPAAQALGGYILGLINPYTLAAAAVGTLAVSYLAANSGISAATRVMIESGNQAGITASQLQSVAEAVAGLGGSTTGRAAQLLAELAKSGDLGSEGLARYARAAIDLERAGGQAADKTVEAFNELGKSPVAAALKLNSATNFLTRSIYEQARALEEQGRAAEAARLVADAYASAIESRTPVMEASLNVVQRAWRGVADEAKSALDFYLSAFRTATTQDQLNRVRKQIAELEAAGQKAYLIGPSIADLRERERNLQELLRLDQKSADRDRARKQQVEAADVIAKLEADTMTKQQRMQKELARFNLAADTAGIDPERRARLEAAIREKYTEKKTGDSGLAKARLGEELADIRSAEQERQSVYRQSEAVIEAERRAGLLNEEAYFEARRSLAEGDTQSRISALQQEILVMSRFKGTATEEAQVRKDIATAAGRIGQASAEAIGRDLVLRTQQTAALNAQKRALVELQQAADAEYEALKRRLGVQVRETGTGSRRSNEEAQLEATAAEFTRRQNQLDAEYRNGRLRGREDLYRQELDLLITEEGKQLRAIEEFQRRKRDADADYRNGLSRGIQNVIDGTFETANRTARLTEDAFTGLGDALTDVFTKGKADWGSLEQTILSGITRIIVEQQLIRPIAQYLGGGPAGGVLGALIGSVIGGIGNPVAGGTGFGDYNSTAMLAGQRANGGPVERGGLYEINERRQGPGEVLNVGGRQYLMALQGGYVQPVGSALAAGSGASLQQVNHFHISGPIDRRTQQQIAVQAGRAAQQAMARG